MSEQSQKISVALGAVRKELGYALSPFVRDELMKLENAIADENDLFPRLILFKEWARRMSAGLTP